jgi:microcin C transport system substrate-binding protein
MGLLKEAGYSIKDQKLVGPDGQPVEFEILLDQPNWERIVQPFIRNLERLGVKATLRTVDTAQYINRVNAYDYDMIVGVWGETESPGNEQREFWGSEVADKPGGRNLVGIKNPAVDTLVDAIIHAPDRASLVTATHALDRVLLWNHYVIPQHHAGFERLAYWNRLAPSPKDPKYGSDITAWWFDAAKDKQLSQSAPGGAPSGGTAQR